MQEMILCKLGEVVLKGLNRRSFEDKLIANLRRRTAKCGNFRVYSKQSTIYVEPVDESCDLDRAFDACRKVFGIIAVSRALPCEKDVQAIIATAKSYLHEEMSRARSFKVESDEYPSGTVAQEFQKGYTYHGTVIRYSMVGVVQ